MGAGETLSPGESLVSPNGRYWLTLGHHGELGLYDSEQARAGDGPSLRSDAIPALAGCSHGPTEDRSARRKTLSVCGPYSFGLVDGPKLLWGLRNAGRL